MAIATIRRGGHARAFALALALAVLGSILFAASAAALPAKFWGAVPQSNLSTEQLNRIDRGGVESIRVAFDWGSLQPQRGEAISWSETDAVIERAAKAGIDVLPTVTGAPGWAAPYVNVPGAGGAKAPAHLPTSGAGLSGWKQFLRQAVERYGPNGEFWATHPEVPARPMRTWQLWNEPNFRYFVAKPNPKEYGKLVKLSYPVIHGADPGAQIVLAGLYSQPSGSRHLERGARGRCWSTAPAATTSPATSSNRCTRRTRGSGRGSPASPSTPTRRAGTS